MFKTHNLKCILFNENLEIVLVSVWKAQFIFKRKLIIFAQIW